MANGWFIFFGLLWAYIVFLFWLARSGRMEKWNLSLMLGLVLMIRTQRGRGTIDAISRPKRFWNAFGDFGTTLTLVGMVAMTSVMVFSVFVVLQPDSGIEPLAGNEIFIIPGVTPFLPLWYGIAALIVTLVVHEGGHGVLARANNLKVKSLGLLYAIVPIGAFVEPDEEELQAAPRRHRLRVFAAGATVNIVVAGALMFAFAAMVGAAEPIDGVPIIAITEGSAAEAAGITPGDIIVAINGNATNMADDFSTQMAQHGPGDAVTITMSSGAALTATLGDRWSDGLLEKSQLLIANLTADRSQDRGDLIGARAYCDSLLGPDGYTDGGSCAEGLQRLPFLGVNHFPVHAMHDRLAHPTGEFGNFLLYVSMPIGEVRDQPYLSYYIPTFLDEPFEGYWILASLTYWVFWINLMVGLTNILPMLPLDGGHIFRDAMGWVLEKVRPGMDGDARTKLTGRLAGFMSFFILGAFLLQVLGPRFF